MMHVGDTGGGQSRVDFGGPVAGASAGGARGRGVTVAGATPGTDAPEDPRGPTFTKGIR